MTIREWQQLEPKAAAQAIHDQARSRLAPAQQRAVIAALTPRDALTEAFAAARRVARPLAGAPFLIKDLFDIPGVPTLAGSTFLPEVRPVSRDAESLLAATARQVGLVCAGKTHLHEFAYGITGENPHYGDCERPGAPGRTSGGSSSGSAAAVAAGVVPLAFGTDTGGSIRVPAAFCGVYGFRGAARDAWIRDAFPLAPSLDTAGWFCRTPQDMALALQALVPSADSSSKSRGCYLPLAVADPEVAAQCAAAARACGAAIDSDAAQEASRCFASATSAYNIIVAEEAWEAHASWAERFRERYDPAVWQRLNRARGITPTQREDAVETRRQIRACWERLFRAYDFVALPATPFPALTKAGCTLENRNQLLALTTPASLAGLPALTLPLRLASGLSAGLQVVVPSPASAALPPLLALAAENPERIFT